MNHEETRKSGVPLTSLHGIEVRPIRREERTRWDELMYQYHYLGHHSLIGESSDTWRSTRDNGMP